MLRTELARRVPEALKDEGGPWKLVAWLDQVQPPIQLGSRLYPSFSLKILQDQILKRLSESPSIQTLRQALSDVASEALEAERDHHLQAISDLLEQSQERLKAQIEERLDAVDTFFEGLALDEEAGTRRPTDLLNELSNLARMPLKLSNDEQRALVNDPKSVAPVAREQVEASLYTQAIGRLVGAIERRIDEVLDVNADALSTESWSVVSETLQEAAESALQKRGERYLGDGGQIIKDLNGMLERLPSTINEQVILALLMQLPRGSRALFDRRTHRRIVQRTTRLTYMFSVARYLEDQKPEQISEDVLEHLEGAQQAIRSAWGLAEFARLGGAAFTDIDPEARRGILEALGYKEDPSNLSQPLSDLSAEQKAAVVDELGRRALTGIYRQLLLGVITELWVEYLTQMEALRVSIGLEAYAQRDPLVQYKSRAAELYQNLQRDIRMGVVTRMFTYRPRDLSQVQVAVARPDAPVSEAPVLEAEVAAEAAAEAQEVEAAAAVATEDKTSSSTERSGGKKRKRHRR
jgi:preprotein translocase subunit SecA